MRRNMMAGFLPAKYAKTLISCSEEIQEATETIMRSCNTPSFKGKAHEKLLRAKAHDLKKLAALYRYAGNRMLRDVRILASGSPNDKVLADVLVYGLFLLDQTKCEEYDAHCVLRKLLEDHQDRPEHLKP